MFGVLLIQFVKKGTYCNWILQVHLGNKILSLSVNTPVSMIQGRGRVYSGAVRSTPYSVVDSS